MKHQLVTVIFTVIVATIAGSEGWDRKILFMRWPCFASL